MIKKESRKVTRAVRQKRVRATVKGTAERPRLCVFRSLNNIYAQIQPVQARLQRKGWITF